MEGSQKSLRQKIQASIDPDKSQEVHFKYTGQTALTAVGKITGKHYRFERAGDTQTVDFRDAYALSAIPVLKRVDS